MLKVDSPLKPKVHKSSTGNSGCWAHASDILNIANPLDDGPKRIQPRWQPVNAHPFDICFQWLGHCFEARSNLFGWLELGPQQIYTYIYIIIYIYILFCLVSGKQKEPQESKKQQLFLGKIEDNSPGTMEQHQQCTKFNLRDRCVA